ncbi:hypothetical protein, partial [Pyxidicoccus trucidator]|uniref:hypothetical protein n=1 Tax=Pyxidicoccus trucidator TaxID=2709662 RepID=UPI001967BBBF
MKNSSTAALVSRGVYSKKKASSGQSLERRTGYGERAGKGQGIDTSARGEQVGPWTTQQERTWTDGRP